MSEATITLPEWTLAVPTKPGLYRHRYPSGETTWTIVRMRPRGELHADYFGYGDGYPVKNMTGEWQGPIIVAEVHHAD